MDIKILFLECIAMCFILFLPCVLLIAGGAHHAAFFYEKEVQDRVVELGLITRERIERNRKAFKYSFIFVMVSFAIWAVYWINGARGFWQPFWQLYVLTMAEGMFDLLFIDWYWVEHTKAWIIPGTEDLRPYITKNQLVFKWGFTLVGNPLMADTLVGIMLIFIR